VSTRFSDFLNSATFYVEWDEETMGALYDRLHDLPDAEWRAQFEAQINARFHEWVEGEYTIHVEWWEQPTAGSRG
jgi:hypothetical protein